uniref:mRNA capping enzyme adenylation domain-containing protein n=1 Tax=Globisporangium ultimum (strain ATCC 200006 / CBS 805.95 / DAOM BR144) TaxID=431595 RepID=K3WGD1_GLOUD
MAGDDGDTKVTVVTTDDAEARAAIAAKLKLAAKIPASKLLNGSSSSQTKRAGRGGSNGGGGRKLLHKSPEQWSAFEQTPVTMSIVPSARILPIRCPLSSLYEIHFSNKQKVFTPSTLMEKLIADSRSGTVVNVGTVIDATGGSAFLYDPKEWDDWEVEYVKLKVNIPEDILEQDRQANDDAMLAAFFSAVEKHKSGDNKDMDIAVYGATGYSFVGFLTVSYLIEYCGLSLDSAVSEFAASSPPGIYSPYYLERLYRKYFSTLASSSTRLSCPPAPKWDPAAGKKGNTDIGPELLTEQDQTNKFVRKSLPARPQATTPIGNGKPAYTAPVPVYKPPLYIPPDRADMNNRPTKRRKIRSWMDDVPPLAFGEPVDPSSEEHEVAMKALEKLTGHEGFPGCEAIPLTATHVAERAYSQKGCLTKNYLVTWRARGRRCLLFVSKDATYVVSRDMTFTKVNMKFPRKRAPAECQVNTLIDGIIVEDQDQGTKVSRYLAFDIIFIDGTPIWQKKLEKRLQCLQNEVILARKNDQTFDYAKEPFRVRMKDHFRLVKTEYLLQKFVKSVTHDVDGVIYTPTEALYNLGGFESDEPIFKFVSSEAGGGIPGLDGSITERRLLSYIQSIPQNK